MSVSLIEQLAAGQTPDLVALTVEQFHRMVELGILPEGEPIELVEGVLLRKDRATAPEGKGGLVHSPRHAAAIARLVRLERDLDPAGCHLRIQLPLTLSPISEPEPDVAIVAGSPERFTDRHPGPADVRVVIEVSDSSLVYDRVTKQRVYASAGIPVYLIVNLVEDQVECCEEPVPAGGRYRRRTDLRSGETLTLTVAAGSARSVAVADILGPSLR
jgi:Uma2 family endonuclease